MFCKWMMAEVLPAQRESFDVAQAQWQAQADCAGFIAQIGGWVNASSENHWACILGLWRDAWAYGEFMSEAHERITAQNRQEGTYQQLQTSYWLSRRSLTDVPLQSSSLPTRLTATTEIQVSEYEIQPQQRERFETAHAPQTTPTELLAGVLWQGTRQRRNAENHYLLTRFYAGDAGHPGKPSPTDDAPVAHSADRHQALAQERSLSLLLEPHWTVLAH